LMHPAKRHQARAHVASVGRTRTHTEAAAYAVPGCGQSPCTLPEQREQRNPDKGHRTIRRVFGAHVVTARLDVERVSTACTFAADRLGRNQ
ncbi:MAG TPA: hypothetical protein VGS80_17500, partial [Ktedonobacterales bacterium]|nr:hypothetical protein [Ktedonobacterales bacterium]